jgi:gas vesicle protein
MSDEKNRAEQPSAHNHEHKHHFGLGVLTGATVGAVIALLYTPRTGAQMRHEIGDQWTRAKGKCSTGYVKAKDKAGHWTERSHHAYDVARTKVTHGARETRQYVREVSDAVTRKAHHKDQQDHKDYKDARTAANVDFAMVQR